MSSDYLTHWLLGFLCSVIWFWGDKLGIPAAAVQLAGSVVPALLGHAVAYNVDSTTSSQVVSPQVLLPADVAK